MSSFEFVFSLLVILLGLGLGQVLGGLASAVKRPGLSIGWATGLLATWVMAETVFFWQVIWTARDVLPDETPAMFGGFAITALYYFAGALVFPDEIEGRTSLDDYFMQEKAKVIGAVLAAITLSFALRPAIMGWASWSALGWYDWLSLATIFALGATTMAARRREVAIACLAVMVTVDLLDPLVTALSGEINAPSP